MSETCELVSTRKYEYNLHLYYIAQKLFKKSYKYPPDFYWGGWGEGVGEGVVREGKRRMFLLLKNKTQTHTFRLKAHKNAEKNQYKMFSIWLDHIRSCKTILAMRKSQGQQFLSSYDFVILTANLSGHRLLIQCKILHTSIIYGVYLSFDTNQLSKFSVQ